MPSYYKNHSLLPSMHTMPQDSWVQFSTTGLKCSKGSAFVILCADIDGYAVMIQSDKVAKHVSASMKREVFSLDVSGWTHSKQAGGVSYLSSTSVTFALKRLRDETLPDFKELNFESFSDIVADPSRLNFSCAASISFDGTDLLIHDQRGSARLGWNAIQIDNQFLNDAVTHSVIVVNAVKLASDTTPGAFSITLNPDTAVFVTAVLSESTLLPMRVDRGPVIHVQSYSELSLTKDKIPSQKSQTVDIDATLVVLTPVLPGEEDRVQKGHTLNKIVVYFENDLQQRQVTITMFGVSAQAALFKSLPKYEKIQVTGMLKSSFKGALQLTFTKAGTVKQFGRSAVHAIDHPVGVQPLFASRADSVSRPDSLHQGPVNEDDGEILD